jgi:hypothetical protein
MLSQANPSTSLTNMAGKHNVVSQLSLLAHPIEALACETSLHMRILTISQHTCVYGPCHSW